MQQLRFGTFIPPIHAVDDSPSLCIERDMQLVEHLDALGFHEAWFGEHHSGGAEIYGSPELIIAALAGRTSQIRLGTGVTSLPYHHPLIVADRWMQLHHMTRGRAMFGCGPGALQADARMLGIQPERQRAMMEEALGAITALLRGETVTLKTDWFTLDGAQLQLRPYPGHALDLSVACVVSPSGPLAAGRHGTGLLSVSATAPAALDAARLNWQVAEETAAIHGHAMDRKDWRMVGFMHVAPTREQALAEVEYGIHGWVKYFEEVTSLPMVPPDRTADPAAHLIESGMAVIGTPDECVRQLERLWDASGGFGCYLVADTNWATFPNKLRSYEMIARFVMPRVADANVARHGSYASAMADQPRAAATQTRLVEQQFERLEQIRHDRITADRH